MNEELIKMKNVEILPTKGFNFNGTIPTHHKQPFKRPSERFIQSTQKVSTSEIMTKIKNVIFKIDKSSNNLIASKSNNLIDEELIEQHIGSVLNHNVDWTSLYSDFFNIDKLSKIDIGPF